MMDCGFEEQLKGSKQGTSEVLRDESSRELRGVPGHLDQQVRLATTSKLLKCWVICNDLPYTLLRFCFCFKFRVPTTGTLSPTVKSLYIRLSPHSTPTPATGYSTTPQDPADRSAQSSFEKLLPN